MKRPSLSRKQVVEQSNFELGLQLYSALALNNIQTARTILGKATDEQREFLRNSDVLQKAAIIMGFNDMHTHFPKIKGGVSRFDQMFDEFLKGIPHYLSDSKAVPALISPGNRDRLDPEKIGKVSDEIVDLPYRATAVNFGSRGIFARAEPVAVAPANVIPAMVVDSVPRRMHRETKVAGLGSMAPQTTPAFSVEEQVRSRVVSPINFLPEQEKKAREVAHLSETEMPEKFPRVFGDSDLHHYARYRLIEETRNLLRDQTSPADYIRINRSNDMQDTPFHILARTSHPNNMAIASTLMENGGRAVINQTNLNGETALEAAISSNNVEMVELFLRNKARIPESPIRGMSDEVAKILGDEIAARGVESRVVKVEIAPQNAASSPVVASDGIRVSEATYSVTPSTLSRPRPLINYVALKRVQELSARLPSPAASPVAVSAEPSPRSVAEPYMSQEEIVNAVESVVESVAQPMAPEAEKQAEEKERPTVKLLLERRARNMAARAAVASTHQAVHASAAVVSHIEPVREVKHVVAEEVVAAPQVTAQASSPTLPAPAERLAKILAARKAAAEVDLGRVMESSMLYNPIHPPKPAIEIADSFEVQKESFTDRMRGIFSSLHAAPERSGMKVATNNPVFHAADTVPSTVCKPKTTECGRVVENPLSRAVR